MSFHLLFFFSLASSFVTFYGKKTIKDKTYGTCPMDTLQEKVENTGCERRMWRCGGNNYILLGPTKMTLEEIWKKK